MANNRPQKQDEPDWAEQFEMVDDSENPEIKTKYDKKYNDPVKNFVTGLSEVFFGTPWRIFNTLLTFGSMIWCLNNGHISIWCPVAGIYAIFTNLRSKTEKGELSAYSILNKNFEKAIGSYKDEYRQYKPEYENKVKKDGPKTFLDMTSDELAAKSKEYFQKKSKYVNKPCYCGSKNKYKKCCYKADMDTYYNQMDEARQEMKDYM